MKRVGVILIFVLAFMGLADSVYLAEHESSGTSLLCNVQNLSGCNLVANSQYSHIFGIPVADFGVVFYGVLFALAALEFVVINRLVRRVMQGFALIGLLVSLYSTFVQAFFIHEWCIYCLASAFIALCIFILAAFIEPIKKAVHVYPAPVPLPMPPRM